MDPNLVEQLRRQSLWLRESWLWLLRSKVLGAGERTALEVGCGAGHVMEVVSELMEVKGIDNDPDMVAMCREKGLDVIFTDAEHLPFEDGSFDVVYCSYFMLWLPEPAAAIREMSRVSAGWVACLAEPDYGGRIDFPPGLEKLGWALVSDLEAAGADPFMGRKLRGAFAQAGLEAEIAVHQGVWSLEKTRLEIRRDLESAGQSDAGVEMAVNAAAQEGSLLQYNPVFWALARKE
jgi:SAM-dependent methyltransferase